jgi:hypothetical protein
MVYQALECWNLVQTIPHHYFIGFLKGSSKVEILDYYSKAPKYEEIAGPFLKKTLTFFLKQNQIKRRDQIWSTMN